MRPAVEHKLFNNKKYADATFIYGDKNDPSALMIHVNKCILALESEYYDALFYGPLADKGPIYVRDSENYASDFLIIEYVYQSGFEKELSLEEITTLYQEANRLLIKGLKDDLEWEINRKLKVNTDINIIRSLTQAGLDLVKFFCVYLKTFLKQPEYVAFFKENPDIMFDILKSIIEPPDPHDITVECCDSECNSTDSDCA